MATLARKRFKVLGTHGLVLLWLFHISIGVFLHYHPSYTHAHTGALEPHSHGGYFHSEQMEQLAQWIHAKSNPLRAGESHHHDESLPGNDSENIQFHVNKLSLPSTKIVLPVQFVLEQYIDSEPELSFYINVSHQTSSKPIPKFPSPLSERSPPQLHI
jgi:hypothetical protein